MIKQHLVLCRPGFAGALASEFADRWGRESAECGAGKVVHKAAVAFPERAKLPPLAQTVFARQYLPSAMRCPGSDEAVVAFVMGRLETLARRAKGKSAPKQEAGQWTLQCFAIDDDPAIARAIKIEKLLMAAIRARMPDLPNQHAQIFIAGPDEAWVSMISISAWAHVGISPHPGGVRRMRKVPGAPSRSSSKLSEALEFLKDAGVEPAAGETAVDLGAAPGGWTLVMALRGVDVTAVDHAELDLPAASKMKGRVTHLRENGLKFRPDEPVDWLCCDMVMGSRQTLDVLAAWMRGDGLMRRFVVNIKLPQADENPWPAVKEALELFAEHKSRWKILAARHLFHDRSEVTLLGAR